MRNILKRFRPLLSADPTIQFFVKEYPEITFKHVLSLRDRLVHSRFNAAAVSKTALRGGTSPFGHCDICKYVDNKQKCKLPNGKWHSTKALVTCQTEGVIYLAQWLCVGKTKQPFYVSIRDHIKPILKKKIVTANSRHVGIHHKFDPSVNKFLALDHVPLDLRGGSVDGTQIQLEVRWIYDLRATQHPGFNENLSFKPFL